MKLLNSLNDFLWNSPLLFLLMGTHLFFTMKLHIPQRRIGKALRFSITPEKQSGQPSRNLSAFGALATTLAATLGTGNIIGVSTAVALGGPGAVLGGVESIGRLCMKTVPLLGFLYIASCFLLLFLNRDALFPALKLIVAHALTPHAALGGIAGVSLKQAARYGIARGLFTNEAGIGTSAIAAASSNSQNPSRQAYVSMTAVFWDTVVMCFLSGLVIVANMMKHPQSLAGVNETGLADAAFACLPFGGNVFLSLSLAAFAITTLIGWSYFGEKAFCFLWGEHNLGVYRLLYIVMIYIGAVIPLEIVWECTDFINALMILPNVISLFCLQRMVRDR